MQIFLHDNQEEIKINDWIKSPKTYGREARESESERPKKSEHDRREKWQTAKKNLAFASPSPFRVNKPLEGVGNGEGRKRRAKWLKYRWLLIFWFVDVDRVDISIVSQLQNGRCCYGSSCRGELVDFMSELLPRKLGNLQIQSSI